MADLLDLRGLRAMAKELGISVGKVRTLIDKGLPVEYAGVVVVANSKRVKQYIEGGAPDTRLIEIRAKLEAIRSQVDVLIKEMES